MSAETEIVLDRRRLRRGMSFWRALALIAVVLALGFLLLSQKDIANLLGQKQIARVAITGTITEDRAQLKMLKQIANADYVEGVIVFVNSPGGTTTGGEALYEALRTISKKKPVVAQFGTVAASAGYITGLGTDYIVARGNTITGSVGVLLQWPQVTELLDKIGVKMQTIRSGPLKAKPSPVEELDEHGREVAQLMISDSFDWFLSLVQKRRNITVASVPGLRQGSIYSGRKALELNLVDEIGGEETAVAWLERERKVTPDLDIVDWKPETPDPWGGTSALSGAITSIFGKSAGAFAQLLSRDRLVSTLGLDGLVSVWHPAEN